LHYHVVMGGRSLRGVRGRETLRALIRAGGISRPGKGDHVNVKMPNGTLITIPGRYELKIGLLKAMLKKAGLAEERFVELLR
jgi:predicted RNA binding protein YcfA (HicA-like mRNA interferase family)